jgi:hypothetical protein
MGIMDKVKATAEKAATEAKKGAGIAKDKLEDVQLRRKADNAAQRLGYLIYKERTGGAAAGAEADSLVKEIKDLEAQIQAEKNAGDG